MLKDESFDVKQGEVGGINRHNGFGKVTLLKVFSWITTLMERTVDPYDCVDFLLDVEVRYRYINTIIDFGYRIRILIKI
jgi:ABC-type polysaccharide/polyol phosphate transport system ATPase subunit